MDAHATLSWPKRAALRAWSLIKDTYDRYDTRHGDLLAAAFSYYSLMSVAPLAVIAVTVAGLVMDPQSARSGLVQAIERASGHDIAQVLTAGIEAAQMRGGGIGALIALALLLWAASRMFTVVQEALNTIWGLRPKPVDGVLAGIRRVAFKRLISFAMVLGCGALLLASLVVQTTVASVRSTLLDELGLSGLQGRLAFFEQLALGLAVLSLAFTLTFRLLPDAHVRWRDAFIGALATAAMVMLGTTLLGLYLSRIAPHWLQGAVGSIAAFLIWSYYLAQVFLLGAALTRVRATCFGGELEPAPYAELAP